MYCHKHQHARAVEERAREVEGVEVELRPVQEFDAVIQATDDNAGVLTALNQQKDTISNTVPAPISFVPSCIRHDLPGISISRRPCPLRKWATNSRVSPGERESCSASSSLPM
jgi:hypothetical protein